MNAIELLHLFYLSLAMIDAIIKVKQAACRVETWGEGDKTVAFLYRKFKFKKISIFDLPILSWVK